MKKILNKGLCIGILAVSLSLGFASISLADEMGGMNMGGMNMGGNTSSQTAPATQNQSQQQNNSMPGMEASGTQQQNANNGMAGMPGMDQNMPGMETDAHGDKEGASEGVNWYVVGGFLVINFLTIGTAGVLKFAKIIPNRI